MQNYIEEARKDAHVTSATGRHPVTVFCVLIGSLGDQAERLRAALPAGRAYIAHSSDEVPSVLQQIFSATLNV